MGTFLRKGTTFVDGVTVANAANLNSHVDDGIIEPTAISALTNKSVLAGTEEVMINDGGTLKKSSVSSVSDYVSAIPIGTVVDFAGITPPDGWFMCYGQAISRTTYSDLFAAIGATYGSGDGVTTFNIPDCRGRVIAGKDNMGGTSADRMLVSVTTGDGLSNINGDTLGATGGNQRPQQHVHDYSYTSFIGGSGIVGGSGIALSGATVNTSGMLQTPSTSVMAIGNSGNVQPTIIMHKVIKY